MATDLQIPFFPHRLNQDGSYDSICLQCLATVANAKTSQELDAYDIDHRCRESYSWGKKLLRRFD